MSYSLRPHGLQHTRLPCPSLTPGAYSNSCPSCLWCHPTISSSVVLFSHLQSFYNFYFYFILLYNTVLVLPYIDMNQPRVNMSPQSWTPLPPPTPYHLSGSSPCTSPKHPVSCIEHRLAIRFLPDSIHVILPNHPTLSLSHRVQKSILYIYVSFAVLHTGLSLPSF